jgi:addiction module HigA family antidote
MKNPPHPGELIKTEIVEALGLNVSKAAEILKVRRATLSDLLRGKAALTPEMALRIEKAFGPDMNHLLRMQLAYDVAKMRKHSREIPVERHVPAKTADAEGTALPAPSPPCDPKSKGDAAQCQFVEKRAAAPRLPPPTWNR